MPSNKKVFREGGTESPEVIRGPTKKKDTARVESGGPYWKASRPSAELTVSSTEPHNPQEGDLWVDTTTL